jgi:hypothetical protein
VRFCPAPAPRRKKPSGCGNPVIHAYGFSFRAVHGMESAEKKSSVHAQYEIFRVNLRRCMEK